MNYRDGLFFLLSKSATIQAAPVMARFWALPAPTDELARNSEGRAEFDICDEEN